MKSYILYMESDGIAKLKDPHNLYFTVQHTDSHFILFPNPVKNRLEIHCKNQNDAFDYKIYSSSGQLIDSGMHRTSPIEIEHLFQGFYFIELQAAGKKLQPILVEFVKE